MKRETRSFLERGFILFSLCEAVTMNSTFIFLAPTPSCRVFPSDWGLLAHQVGYSQGLSTFSLGHGPRLLSSSGPEFWPQDTSLDRMGPIHRKTDGQGLPGPPSMDDPLGQAGLLRKILKDAGGTYLHTWAGDGPSSGWCHADM